MDSGVAASTTATTTAMRGICYGALPCKEHHCADQGGMVSEDMLQEAYAKEWGKAPEGRDDLQKIATLGANTVRLYHSLGENVLHDHSGFLDRAQEVKLNVMAGYHTYGSCPKFDCYKAWKKATLQGFKDGFKTREEGKRGWHPAVSALILLNEPDFFGGFPECQPAGAWCRVKAALSALDGVLAAERQARVDPGRVRLTVTWSFGMMPSIDGKEHAPGMFGFEDMVAGIADPSLAHYEPRSSLAQLQHAFKTRWMHGVNTQAPWGFVKSVIANNYAAKYAPVPWFIGEYGANGQSYNTIKEDLMDMQKTAEEDPNFLGAAFFQFQTAHFKGGPELNFGLFKLGKEKLFEIQPPCDIGLPDCHKLQSVYCLSPVLDWLPGSLALRAEAVAAAWKGSMPTGEGMCHGASEAAAAARTTTTVAVTSPAELGACSWPALPLTPFVWDPSCTVGQLGCDADGVHIQCRFCGEHPFSPCPTTVTSTTTTTATRSTTSVTTTITNTTTSVTTTSSTVAKDMAPGSDPALRGTESSSWRPLAVQFSVMLCCLLALYR